MILNYSIHHILPILHIYRYSRVILCYLPPIGKLFSKYKVLEKLNYDFNSLCCFFFTRFKFLKSVTLQVG